MALAAHDGNLFFAEGNCPGQRAKGIGAKVKSQKIPEGLGDAAIKVAVDHSTGKGRGILCGPDDAVELLPWVTIIIPVKIDDCKNALIIDHHIANMIVAMLVGLGTVGKKMTVGGNIGEEWLVERIL